MGAIQEYFKRKKEEKELKKYFQRQKQKQKDNTEDVKDKMMEYEAWEFLRR